jgi:transcriptional regulator with XRE-family HTH domain
VLRKIATIVQSARDKAGLAVEGLARLAGVELALLHALERGEPSLSTEQLRRVAEQLELDCGSLLLGQEVRRPTVSVFLRHGNAQDFAHDTEATLDHALEAGRMLRFLNDRLGLEPSLRRSRNITLREPGPSPFSDGYELARRLRRLLGLPLEALGDLGATIEDRFEIVVVVLPLGTAKMTAVSVRDDAGSAAIVLNADDPQRHENPQLARVHLAHELCHVLHDPSEGGLHLVIDRADEDDVRARHMRRAEVRARAFAAELLLPLQGLVDVLKTPRYVESEGEARELVVKARSHFCTPWEIAANHLNHHGYISDDARITLLQQGPQGAPVGTIGTRLPVPGAPSVVLAERLRRAHDEGIVTDGQARVALGLSVDSPLPWS